LKKITYPGPLWFVVYSVSPATSSKRAIQISEIYLLCDSKILGCSRTEDIQNSPCWRTKGRGGGRKIAVHNI